MSIETIRSTLTSYFDANFTGAKVEYENHKTLELGTLVEPYVALALRFTSNTQVGLGENALTRQRGALQADVYVKSGTGTKVAYLLIGTIQALFKRKSISGIEFQIPTTLTPLEVAGWHRLTIRCPFYFDS